MIEILVNTNDVRGNTYKNEKSVTVEIYYNEDDDISIIVDSFKNLDVWFSGFNESNKRGLTVLWQGDKND